MQLHRDATVKYFYLIASDLYRHRDVKYNQQELNKLAETLKNHLFEGSMEIKGLVDRTSAGIANCNQLK